jgi:hypothetical protein
MVQGRNKFSEEGFVIVGPSQVISLQASHKISRVNDEIMAYPYMGAPRLRYLFLNANFGR